MAISVWCLPCAQDAAPYEAVIERLAEKQGAPVFPPHLTLGTLATETLPALEGLAACLAGLRLEPQETDSTDVFTTALFVRFRPAEALQRARKRLEHDPHFHAGRTFDPHISLCYGPAPAGSETRRDVQALLETPVRFDRLVPVRLTPPILTYSDVSAWQIGRTIPFPAGASG